MAQYYLFNFNSETIAKNLATASATPVASTLSTTVAKSTTTTISYVTAENIPSNTSWGTQTISMVFNISTLNASIQLALTPYRVDATGNILDTGTQSAFVTVSATGALTVPGTAFAFAAGSATDRLAIDVAVKNTSATQSKTVAWEVNTVNSYISSPITEWSGSTAGTIVASGQYSHTRTPVAIGAMTGTDGNTTPLWLEADVYSKAPAYVSTIGEEAKTTATSFVNTADLTSQSSTYRQSNLPNPMYGSVMGYDSVNQRYIFTGGYDATTYYNDLWEMTANTYSRLNILTPTGTAPVAKYLGASVMLTSATKAWFIYWGGINSSAAGVNDMLIADCSTRGSESWTTITQTGAPSARDNITHHMIARVTGATTFDVYLWGGLTQAGARANDMYKCSFDLSAAMPTTVTWTTITQTSAPTARSGACFIYDSANDRGILHSGYDGSTYLADTHAFNFTTNTWTTISPTGTIPAGRALASCGYDVAKKRMIIFAGWQGSLTASRNDIVSLGLTAGAETIATIRANDMSNMAFFPYSGGSACVDTNRNIIVEYGQNGYDCINKYFYAFDLNNTDSTYAPLYGLNMAEDFRGRDAPGACIDTTRNLCIFSNGFSLMADDGNFTYGDHHNQQWGFNWTNNTIRYLNAGYLGAPYREGVMAVYDSTNDRIVQFGGLSGTGQVSNETWELKPDIYGNLKARLMKPTGSLPTARWLMAGGYDATRNRLIIWSGASTSTILANTDMWQLDLSTSDGAWTSLSATGTAPPAVRQPMYALDNTNHKLYVASGATNFGSTSFSTRLDVLDITNATPAWSNLATTGITGVRGGMMAIDVATQYLWAFGGFDGTSVYNTLYTFKLSGSTWTTVTATGGPPEARRSGAFFFANGKFYIGVGRPVSGRWYSNVWELTPNYTTLNSSTWLNKVPQVYHRDAIAITGKSNGNYHWQSLATIGGTSTPWASFGNNTESSIDFTVGNGSAGVNLLPFFRP